jgi:hypothetical protein
MKALDANPEPQALRGQRRHVRLGRQEATEERAQSLRRVLRVGGRPELVQHGDGEAGVAVARELTEEAVGAPREGAEVLPDVVAAERGLSGAVQRAGLPREEICERCERGRPRRRAGSERRELPVHELPRSTDGREQRRLVDAQAGRESREVVALGQEVRLHAAHPLHAVLELAQQGVRFGDARRLVVADEPAAPEP